MIASILNVSESRQELIMEYKPYVIDSGYFSIMKVGRCVARMRKGKLVPAIS